MIFLRLNRPRATSHFRLWLSPKRVLERVPKFALSRGVCNREGRGPGERRSEAGYQPLRFPRIAGLGEEVIKMFRRRLAGLDLPARQRNDVRYIRRQLAELPRYFEAIDTGQSAIDNRDIRPELPGSFKCATTFVRGASLEPLAVQQKRQCGGSVAVFINGQDFLIVSRRRPRLGPGADDAAWAPAITIGNLTTKNVHDPRPSLLLGTQAQLHT